MVKCILATQNRDKLKEFKTLFKPFPYQLILPAINLQVLEIGKTFQSNSILKAKAYGQYFGLPVIADDSGLCIDFLNGRPGVHSHRFAVNGFSAARKNILKLMQGLPRSQRTAKFVCSLAYFDPKTKLCRNFTSETLGFITKTEIGTNGFGYDSIFFSSDLNKTFGEASIEEKNQFSHRAKALNKLLTFLRQTTELK